MNQQEQTVSVTLTINQLNAVMAGLDELPHKFSRPVIDAISQQVQPQLQDQKNGTTTVPGNSLPN